MIRRPTRFTLLATAAVLLGALWCALYPFRLTGVLSTYTAALAQEMAAGGWREWFAPHWAADGGLELFYGHPPGAAWPIALLEKLGLAGEAAARVANSLWLWLILLALWSLGGRRLPDKGPGLGALAAGIFLLQLPVFLSCMGAGLELPLAACATSAIAAARSPSRYAPFGVAAAFCGALWTGGVLALFVPVFLLTEAYLSGPHSLRYRARLVVGLMAGAGTAALLDWGHALAVGQGFWKPYTDGLGATFADWRRTLPLSAAETVLPGFLFLVGGTLPWWPLALWALHRSHRRGEFGYKARLLLPAAYWMVIAFVGAAVTDAGSLLLFTALPAVAWFCATAFSDAWRAAPVALRRKLAAATLLLVPLLLVTRSLLADRDDWWRAAEALRGARAELVETGAGTAVYGPFRARLDGRKSLVRLHLGLWAFRAPEAGPPPGSLLWVEGGGERPEGRVVLETPRFALIRVPD